MAPFERLNDEGGESLKYHVPHAFSPVLHVVSFVNTRGRFKAASSESESYWFALRT